MNYYLYQAINLMPQLIVVQLVVWLTGSIEALNFTKTFYLVNLLSILIDWGASSIGSRRLNGLKNNFDNCEYKKSYEIVRAGIFICVIFIYLVLISLNYIGSSIDLSLGVLLGISGTLIFPNWLNITNDINNRLLKQMVMYRLFAIFFLVFLSIFFKNSSMLATYYYAAILLGAIPFRMQLKKTRLKISEKINKDTIKIFYRGAIFTAGTFISYLITGAGSVLILNNFQVDGFLEFAVAERYLAIGRVILGLIFQKSFVKVGATQDNRINIKIVLRYMSFLISFYIAILIFAYLFEKNNFISYFSILFVGFSLSGFSHIWITQNLLGKDKYIAWLLVLITAMCMYLILVALLFQLEFTSGSYVASFATMSAEITIFLIGFFIRKKR